MATVWTFIFYAEVDREGSCRRIGTFGRMTPQVHAIECTSMSGRTCGVPVSIRQSNVGKDRVGGGILVNFLVLNNTKHAALDCPINALMMAQAPSTQRPRAPADIDARSNRGEVTLQMLLARSCSDILTFLTGPVDFILRRSFVTPIVGKDCPNIGIQSIENCMVELLAWNATLEHIEDSIDRRCANLTYERDKIKAKQRGIVCGTRVAASQEQTSRAALIEVSRLPKDFPSSLDDSDYIVHLTEEHLREIDVALGEFKELGLDGDLARRNNFQLPTLEGDLNHLQNEIHNGKGFDLIDGMEPPR
ncbi:hypothetical protein E4U12_000377 [Claviceps purpurea]|nr:hypothetical protein E4U12_000377 [Claviceps purpurea]